MTLFEYLTVAVALLYSAAALRLVSGMSVSIERDRRYWPHLLLTFSLLFVIAIGFWTFWSFRDVAWTFFGFLVALTPVSAIYYCAAVLVPDNASEVASWRDHYFANRGRWYAGWGGWAVALATNATLNLGMPFLHPVRIVHALALTLAIVGFVSSNARVHAVLVVVIAVLAVGISLTMGMDPGWLARI